MTSPLTETKQECQAETRNRPRSSNPDGGSRGSGAVPGGTLTLTDGCHMSTPGNCRPALGAIDLDGVPAIGHTISDQIPELLPRLLRVGRLDRDHEIVGAHGSTVHWPIARDTQ
jgi:hypothetical protein